MKEILVYIQTEQNKIAEFSYDLISYVKEISGGENISGVVLLPENIEIDYNPLQKFGLNKLYVIKTNLPFYDKRKHPYLILELIKKINPEIFILNSTTQGREIAPVVASSLKTGLTADCTKLEIIDNKLISTRPTFGGKLMASILCKNNPQMATFRVNMFKKREFLNGGNFNIENLEFNPYFMPNLKTEILEYKENKQDFVNLQNAKIIFAGGMGLKSKENFDKLKILAQKFNAKVGGTRKAVDKGFIEREYQIGQTGLSVTPDLYVAFGISGAIHHIIGMENSKKIIAINSDVNAPIFSNADIGIKADAIKIIDDLLNE